MANWMSCLSVALRQRFLDKKSVEGNVNYLCPPMKAFSLIVREPSSSPAIAAPRTLHLAEADWFWDPDGKRSESEVFPWSEIKLRWFEIRLPHVLSFISSVAKRLNLQLVGSLPSVPLVSSQWTGLNCASWHTLCANTIKGNFSQ